QAPFQVNICLAILVSIPWTETDTQHVLTIEMASEAGGAQQRLLLSDQLPDGVDPEDRGMIFVGFTATRLPTMVDGDESTMPVSVPLFGIGLPEHGPYFF